MTQWLAWSRLRKQPFLLAPGCKERGETAFFAGYVNAGRPRFFRSPAKSTLNCQHVYKGEMRELLRQEIAPRKLEIEKICKTHDDLQTTVSFLSNKYDDLLSQYRPHNWLALSCFITKVTLSKASGKTLMSLGGLRTKLTCKKKSWLTTSDVIASKSQE